MTAHTLQRAESCLQSGLPAVFVRCVRDSIINTLGAICGECPTELNDQSDDARREGLIGIVSFSGHPAWSVMLGLPPETAIAVARVLTGPELEFKSADLGDVVRELANIVAGQLIAQLDAQGIKTEMSLPAVVRGPESELLLPRGEASNRLSFTSAQGPFTVKVVAATLIEALSFGTM